MDEIEVARTIPAGEPFEALDAILRAQYPAYRGMMSGRGVVRAQVTDRATEQDRAGITQAILTFDITTKSPEQEAKAQNLDRIKTAAQAAVGVALADLTTGQIKALMAVLLWRAGGVNTDGTVKPLGEWLK